MDRKEHILFIWKDTKERGEEVTSKVTIMGKLYFLMVKKEGAKRAKQVVYSAADNVPDKYREIKL